MTVNTKRLLFCVALGGIWGTVSSMLGIPWITSTIFLGLPFALLMALLSFKVFPDETVQ